MAILNFIKTGTYSKISEIIWCKGKVLGLRIDVFENKPTNRFAYVNKITVEAEDGSEEDLYSVMDNTEEQPFSSMNLGVEQIQNLSGSEAEVKKWSDFFEQDLWAANGSDLHTQCYKWMLTLDMFKGCKSD